MCDNIGQESRLWFWLKRSRENGFWVWYSHFSKKVRIRLMNWNQYFSGSTDFNDDKIRAYQEEEVSGDGSVALHKYRLAASAQTPTKRPTNFKSWNVAEVCLWKSGDWRNCQTFKLICWGATEKFKNNFWKNCEIILILFKKRNLSTVSDLLQTMENNIGFWPTNSIGSHDRAHDTVKSHLD